jgi:hypothetical protein
MSAMTEVIVQYTAIEGILPPVAALISLERPKAKAFSLCAPLVNKVLEWTGYHYEELPMFLE